MATPVVGELGEFWTRTQVLETPRPRDFGFSKLWGRVEVESSVEGLGFRVLGFRLLGLGFQI